MVKSGYQDEILEILRVNGGCIEGFNRLLSMRSKGKFHSTRLAINLEQLKKRGEITIKPIEDDKRGKKRYCLPQQDPQKQYLSLTERLEKLEHQMSKSELKITEKRFLAYSYYKLAIHIHNVLLWQFFNRAIFPQKATDLNVMEKMRTRLIEDIDKKLNSLSENERSKIMFMVLDNAPTTRFSLKEYRKSFVGPKHP